MLAMILFVVAVGVLVGGPMARSPTEKGWCLLTVPMSAVMMGLPLAAAFGLLLALLPDPLAGLQGPWRAIPFGSVICALGGGALTFRTTRPERRRTAAASKAAIKFGVFGAVLGTLWGFLQTTL